MKIYIGTSEEVENSIRQSVPSECLTLRAHCVSLGSPGDQRDRQGLCLSLRVVPV